MRIRLFRKRGPVAEDPVCRMEVEMDRAPGGTWEYEGTAYYFCAPGCNRAFQKEPSSYLSGEKNIDM